MDLLCHCPEFKPCHQELHFARPRMVLTGAIAHGYGTFFFLASERLTHGADCFLEILFRTIQHVSDMCVDRDESLPEHLVIQSDNTTAQSKNTYVHMASAHLVASKLFKTVTLNYLMVGHTHEDIGLEWQLGQVIRGPGSRQVTWPMHL